MSNRIFVTGGSGFIGTNLVAELKRDGAVLASFDSAPPLRAEDRDVWCQGDLLDPVEVSAALTEFAPESVIHLAGRTDCDENTTVADYAANTEGTKHLLEAVKKSPSVQRLIITSSQFVCGPGRMPEGDEDYFPHTVYGQSKVITEQLTRSADLRCCWTLIRPTNIWGPWHMRYAAEFWRVLDRGWYVHPGAPSPTRCYGYVGNIVWQIRRILALEPVAVHGKVLYVGDRPINIRRWIEGFHQEMTGRPRLREIPFPLLKLLGRAGDAIGAIQRRPFYLNSSRLRSMTTDYVTPMEPTFQLLGEPPYSLEAGIAETCRWYREWKGRDRS